MGAYGGTPRSADETVRTAIRDVLAARFERRPYRRAAVSGSGVAGETVVTVSSSSRGSFAAARDDCPGEVDRCEIVVSLTAVRDREAGATDLMLELISTLHDADLPAEGVVILDCVFERAWLERDRVHELSHCHAAFSVTSVLE